MVRTERKILKEKAWKTFALWIKLRDANDDGLCYCCTCKTPIDFDSKNCHAGHFTSGRTNAVLFDDRIVHAQCDSCNIWGNGQQGKYAIFMIDKYGSTPEELDELLNLKKKAVILKEYDFKNIIFLYYKLIEKMKQDRFSHRDSILKRIDEKINKIGIKKLLKEMEDE